MRFEIGSSATFNQRATQWPEIIYYSTRLTGNRHHRHTLNWRRASVLALQCSTTDGSMWSHVSLILIACTVKGYYESCGERARDQILIAG